MKITVKYDNGGELSVSNNKFACELDIISREGDNSRFYMNDAALCDLIYALQQIKDDNADKVALPSSRG